MSTDRPKILIADSQFLITDSLIRLIGEESKYALCGIAENRMNLIRLMSADKPDLLITDIKFFDYDGPDDLKSISDNNKHVSILILTNQLTANEVGRLLKSGFKNIALKTDGKEDLLGSIEMALKKKKSLSEQVLELVIEVSGNKISAAEMSDLTQSETEIVKLIADGYTTKEIAAKKHISSHTVMTHRKNIFRKLGISNISELIRYGVRKGLISYMDYNI
jgi:DNA-binding NarL/FixJ family response regulator